MMYKAAELLLIAGQFEKKAYSKKKEVGTIYIIHFDEAIGDKTNPRSMAQHYCGFSTDLDKRLNAHQLGQGSSIMRYVVNSGIPYRVVKTFQGTRDDERVLKNQKNIKRYCPVCSANPKDYLV